MGWAGTGWQFDPIIADQGVEWLHDNAQATDRPWFLAVALVNPHDVMWFPIDQPSYQAEHREEFELTRSFLAAAAVEGGRPAAGVHRAVRRGVRRAPGELRRRPVHEAGRAPAVALRAAAHARTGYIDRDDKQAWLRHLDYYWRLHQEGDKNLGAILDALDASGRADDTAVVFTSDHGDMCGSHGLRSKGPFVYEEIMRVPLYVRAPGITTPGTTTDALGTHVDLARTVASLAGADDPSLVGHDLLPSLREPSTPGRESRPAGAGLGLVRELRPAPVRDAGDVRRAPQVRPLLRRRRQLRPHGAAVAAPEAGRRATPTSRTTTTSCTTSTRTRTSSSTWRTTGGGGARCESGSTACGTKRRESSGCR